MLDLLDRLESSHDSGTTARVLAATNVRQRIGHGSEIRLRADERAHVIALTLRGKNDGAEVVQMRKELTARLADLRARVIEMGSVNDVNRRDVVSLVAGDKSRND